MSWLCRPLCHSWINFILCPVIGLDPEDNKLAFTFKLTLTARGWTLDVRIFLSFDMVVQHKKSGIFSLYLAQLVNAQHKN